MVARLSWSYGMDAYLVTLFYADEIIHKFIHKSHELDAYSHTPG